LEFILRERLRALILWKQSGTNEIGCTAKDAKVAKENQNQNPLTEAQRCKPQPKAQRW
jgi:hypothetical protein